jgi:hypothetical protein
MSNVPVLILAYNRPHYSNKLVCALRNIKPRKIYISCDGPKQNQLDKTKCEETQKIFDKIDWNCLIKKKINKKNYGCKKAISNGINWFFKHEKEGIILEDDCIPTKYFFFFCKKMLIKYKDNKKIHCVGGVNFFNKKIKESYYFSKYNHCWGWATWRNSWKYNDVNLTFWPKFKYTKNWRNFHKTNIEKNYWTKIFDNTFKNKIDSWAYPWTISLWKISGLTVTPAFNLVKNIGVGSDSTHSLFRQKDYFVKKINNKRIIHPKKIKINCLADEFVFKNHFKGKNYLYPWRFIYLFKIFLTNPFTFLKKTIKNIL